MLDFLSLWVKEGARRNNLPKTKEEKGRKRQKGAILPSKHESGNVLVDSFRCDYLFAHE